MPSRIPCIQCNQKFKCFERRFRKKHGCLVVSPRTHDKTYEKSIQLIHWRGTVARCNLHSGPFWRSPALVTKDSWARLTMLTATRNKKKNHIWIENNNFGTHQIEDGIRMNKAYLLSLCGPAFCQWNRSLIVSSHFTSFLFFPSVSQRFQFQGTLVARSATGMDTWGANW